MKQSRDVDDAANEARSPARTESKLYKLRNNGNAAEVTGDTPLSPGTTILDGHYRVLELLHQRPRVNLYLGRRLPRLEMGRQQLDVQESLVIIRELVLADLPEQVQRQVVQAAFEEFVSPAMFGSLRLPGAGDRVRIAGERHYLIMQLRGTHQRTGNNGGDREKERSIIAITLAELLLNRQQWPCWLDQQTAINWCVQLNRIVARLHRLGVVLGDLDPNIVVVDERGPAEWPPVLLVSWPPAPHFWKTGVPERDKCALWKEIFPIARMTTSAFRAPETLQGTCVERSDVYSLGAILYLLLTRYAPVAAQYRQQSDHIELIPPRLFNAQIPEPLEEVLLCALALDPAQRYPTVFAFIEALERIEVKSVEENGTEQNLSPLEKVLRRVRHEL